MSSAMISTSGDRGTWPSRSAFLTPHCHRATLSIDPIGRSGSENMAIDLALLRSARAGELTVRLYRWTPATLSVGRNEAATLRYDRSRIEALGLACVRRPTGGRAVWHDAEVTYAVAGHLDDVGSLRATYEHVHALLAAALHRLGVPATLAPPRRVPRPDAGACFAAPVGGEVVIGGRKLVGSAQVREGRAFLQHGSILLAGNQQLVQQVTRAVAPVASATSLSEILGWSVAFEDVAGAVTAELETVSGSLTLGPGPTPEPAEIARFADPDWTWRR